MPPDDGLVRQCLAGQDRDGRVEAQGFLDDSAGEFEFGDVGESRRSAAEHGVELLVEARFNLGRLRKQIPRES